MGLANKLQPSGAPSAPPAQGAGFAQGGQGQFSAGGGQPGMQQYPQSQGQVSQGMIGGYQPSMQQHGRPGQPLMGGHFPGQQMPQQGMGGHFPGQHQGSGMGMGGQQGQGTQFPGQQGPGSFNDQPQRLGMGAQPGQYGQNGGIPPQQAGMQPQGMGAPGAGGNNVQKLQSKLQQIIQMNQLQGFYPPGGQQFNKALQSVSRVDFSALAQRWNMPLEMAYDLAALALYDIVIYCDDSGSMIFAENGERINDLRLILGRVSEVATLFDDDGILIRFMNSNVQGNGIRDSAAAAQLLQQVNFNGLTPLGTILISKVLSPIVHSYVQSRSLDKPILVICITDGEPTGEPANTILNSIRETQRMCASSPYGPNAAAFQFAQVGKDQRAQAFLATLDNDPTIGSNVDCTSYYELEFEEYARKGVTLTPELWLVKLMVGAIDSSYDEQD